MAFGDKTVTFSQAEDEWLQEKLYYIKTNDPDVRESLVTLALVDSILGKLREP